MNNPMQNFVPFPMFNFGGGENQPTPFNEAPARVRVALEFLAGLSRKTSPLVAISDISIEWQQGQQLTPTELRAQMQAHEMLAQYFEGRMKFDKIEKKLIERDETGEGSLLNCIACAGGPIKAGCKLCKGTGSILVYPSVER